MIGHFDQRIVLRHILYNQSVHFDSGNDLLRSVCSLTVYSGFDIDHLDTIYMNFDRFDFGKFLFRNHHNLSVR
jgi:hypothetical protein